MAKIIVDAAYKVHKALGPGLIEKVYETCFCHELSEHGVQHQRQVIVPVIYKGITFDEGLRLDVFVDNLVSVNLRRSTK